MKVYESRPIAIHARSGHGVGGLWARIGPVTLAALALLVLAGCGTKATPDVQASAEALAHLWATETAQALPTPDVQATAEALARLWATETAQAQPSATEAPPTPLPVPPTDTSTPIPPTPGAPTPTNTATPAQIPTASRTPTFTPTATRTPTATPSPTACPIAVDTQLAPAWDRLKLGCPVANAEVIWSAWEPFQHGYMFWRSDLDWTYLLDWQGGTDDTTGDWVTGGDAWKWDGSFPDGHGLTPPPGLYEPIRGFGFAWYNFLGGPDSQVGWATDIEKGFCANLQRFQNGFLFHSSTIQYCQDEFFNWATNPSFAPLSVALYGDGTWRRY
jgi:hypothetical protein